MRLGEVPIIRHTKVRMEANPYLDTEYFTYRKFQHGMKQLSGRFKKVWRNQNGCCYHCGQPMEISDEREIFYKVPKSMGGKDEVRDMAYVGEPYILEEKADRTVAYANKQELEDAVFQSRIKSAAIPEQTPPVVLHMGRPTGTGRVL